MERAAAARRRLGPAAAGVIAASATLLMLTTLDGPATAQVAGINPVRVDLDGHPANSGFLVFIEGDVSLASDESEGTIAVGGDLLFGTTYNVQAGAAPTFPTFTAPGDSAPTFLYVRGGINWGVGNTSILRVLGGGFTKIGDTSTFEAGNRDSNNALVNYRVWDVGGTYESIPRIEGTTNAQDGASIGTPVPQELIDIDGAFALYREITADIGACLPTVTLTNPDTGDDLVPGWPPGTRGRLELTPDETNVLEISAADLANLAEINIVTPTTAATPLVVNVTGASFSGTVPNLAGVSGAQAPYMLWNFPDATSITVTGGDSIQGTIYAPNADFNWNSTINVEGNIIAARFAHGPTPFVAAPRELHDFPFDTEITCAADTTTTTTTTTTSTTTTTVVPTTTTTTTTVVPTTTTTTIPGTTTTSSTTSSTTTTTDPGTGSTSTSTTTPSGVGPDGGNLPTTGGSGASLLPAALGLLAIGAALVGAARSSSRTVDES